MTITVAQQAELERPAPKVAYFMELQFTTATQYLSTWNRNFTWASQLWLGYGGLVSVAQITESESVVSSSMSFNLNAADPSWIALAVGDDTVYRHRLALMYMCPIGDDGLLIDTPELCWRGRMDSLAIGINDAYATISLKCETAAFAFKRRPTLRMNSMQQKLTYPTDTGFDYLPQILANPQLWLSKKFQGR